MPRFFPLAAAAAATVLLAACGSSSGAGSGGEDGARLHIVTAFYPLEFATQQVVDGVSGVSVETLASPGVDAHDLELTPRQVGSLSTADLVVYSSGMQTAVDAAVADQAGDHSLDTSSVVDLVDRSGEESEGEHDEHDHEGDEHESDDHEGHDHGPLDPHFWLDPQRYAAATDAIAEDLAAADPDHADAYLANAETFTTQLAELDTEFTETLASCEQDTLVTTHEAFGYLADRYGLHQIGITGISPDAEASPARMAEITGEVEDLDVPTIYAESSLGGDLAEVIADETGTEVLVLDPIESITGDSAGGDYLEVMRANLEALRQGQGCS
ncbi:metal ABC transporter substrate-binding protein [Ornithinimicrobium faecis]|uniref:Metal ABC transporter substrate-binding protein n=1 Tax=Ornithinimicrobium faecis TaxID=2934158 RepID=A0ABY4YP13_9MICO|nr:metal ABC transporter substrate-binding protein [Ornithinimicrobium sp. HY1793]USQ78481.1 metal ABC transporter substrate-binding protein [Ornithinimicrobium sp. HY1793]